MARHKLTREETRRGGEAGARAAKRHYARKQMRGDVITQKDCKLIDEACHEFWVKRGGRPEFRDELIFGVNDKPVDH